MGRKSIFLSFVIVFLSLGFTACLPFSLLKDKRSAKKTSQTKSEKRNKQNSNNSGQIRIDARKDEAFVNVMGDELPELPDFDELSPKPGKVRGYVKDANGYPLKGAHIGVRSSYFAGSYSGAQGETDPDGYYEFKVPEGSAHFYNAGYELEWGEGIAAIGLHPADGRMESFATADGAVENFVLLPYGVTSRENLSENDTLPSTYYGGSLYIHYFTQGKDDNNPSSGTLVEDSDFEITLTPEGELIDGSEGRPIIVRHTVGFRGNFSINNIPLGHYKIKVTTADGTPLNVEQTGVSNPRFGMKPNKIADGEEGTILFMPGSAKASMVAPQFGVWERVGLTITPGE